MHIGCLEFKKVMIELCEKNKYFKISSNCKIVFLVFFFV